MLTADTSLPADGRNSGERGLGESGDGHRIPEAASFAASLFSATTNPATVCYRGLARESLFVFDEKYPNKLDRCSLPLFYFFVVSPWSPREESNDDAQAELQVL